MVHHEDGVESRRSRRPPPGRRRVRTGRRGRQPGYVKLGIWSPMRVRGMVVSLARVSNRTTQPALVVGRLVGDLDVVGMALLAAGCGDPHEPGPGAQRLEGGRAGVAHAAAQPAHQLVDDLSERAGVGHPTLDALGDELARRRADGGRGSGLGTRIAVGAEALHRAERAHAPVALVPASLEQLHLARALLGAGEERAEHHRPGAGGDRLDDVAGVRDAAVGDHRHATPPGPPGRVPDRRQLGHPGPADHARGADRARAHADLDRVDAGVGQQCRHPLR